MILLRNRRFGRVVALALLACALVGDVTCAADDTTAATSEIAMEGQSVTFVAVVEGGKAPFTYQWYKNGAPMSDQVDSELAFPSLQLSDTGLYSVVASNGAGQAASMPESIMVVARPRSRLVNISVDTLGSETLVGFSLGGNGVSGSTRVLARAAGPSLTQFNIIGALPDPVLSVFAAGQMIASNDNWGSTELIASTADAVGAFPFPPGSKDSAAVLSLAPSNYTIRVVDRLGATGVALIELYDASSGSDDANPRLVNISTRGTVGAANGRLMAGFNIRGEAPLTLLLRGIGPGLGGFGVSGFIEHPMLTLFQDTTPIASNEKWSDLKPVEIANAAIAVGAFALASNSLDCAMLVTLRPGSYTLQVSSANDLAGLALIEVYEVP